MMTCGGSRLPAVNIISSARFSLKLNRENTKPSIDDTNRVRVTAGIAMISVLMKYLGSSAAFQPLMKLSRVRCFGHDT